MKIINYLRQNIGLATLVSCLILSHSALTRASAFPAEGTYRGLIKTKTGESIPLKLDLSYSDALVKAPDDDLFPMKRAITASAVIDNDGGPYTFGQANFNLETGKFELWYNRSGQSGPTLKLQGNLVSDNQIKGHLVSGLRGDLGTFEVTKDSKVGEGTNSLYEGQYLGTLTHADDQSTIPFKVKLISNTSTSQNPPNLEFEFTPGYAGDAILNSTDFIIQTVSIDYFTHTAYLTHREITGASLTLTAKFTPEGISGFMSSSLKGHTAEFTAKRITP